MQKSDFHNLVRYLPEDEVDPEIREILDAILAVAQSAHPVPAI
jgi:hypothetical protein